MFESFLCLILFLVDLVEQWPESSLFYGYCLRWSIYYYIDHEIAHEMQMVLRWCEHDQLTIVRGVQGFWRNSFEQCSKPLFTCFVWEANFNENPSPWLGHQLFHNFLPTNQNSNMRPSRDCVQISLSHTDLICCRLPSNLRRHVSHKTSLGSLISAGLYYSTLYGMEFVL